jgi:hypothetical protein
MIGASVGTAVLNSLTVAAATGTWQRTSAKRTQPCTGTTGKTVLTDVGAVDLAVPRGS